MVDRRTLYRDIVYKTYVTLVRIEHPELPEPVHIHTGRENLIHNGQEYTASSCNVKLPNKDSNLQVAQIEVQNVDSRIGAGARLITSPAQIYFTLVQAENPDVIEVEYPPLNLSGVEGDEVSIRGELTTRFPLDEPWPKTRATKSVAPAQYADILNEF